MTTVWRICRRPFADLSGDGARLYGGRWNTPGRPLIYAAETAALAVLEVRVHLDLDWDMLPDDYVLVAIDPAAIVAETIHEPPDDPQTIGDAWIEFPAIRTPACPFMDRARIQQCPYQSGSPGCSINSTRPRPAISVRPATVDAAVSSSKRVGRIRLAAESRNLSRLRRPLPCPSGRAVRPFGTRLRDAARSDLRSLRQPMAQPERPFGRASGNSRPMDALSIFRA